MITQQQADRIEKNQERILALLHKAVGNLGAKEWGNYKDACKIINRSKTWFRNMRRERLVEGKDWRMVGNDIEYHLSAVERLKDVLINQRYQDPNEEIDMMIQDKIDRREEVCASTGSLTASRTPIRSKPWRLSKNGSTS